jgi:hypothetical protein
MIFRYWVEFDGEGGIKALHDSKQDGCQEYVVKLIPIDRKKEELCEQSNKFIKSLGHAVKGTKKLTTEIEKVTKELRRIKI